jgi:hypothetical protein
MINVPSNIIEKWCFSNFILFFEEQKLTQQKENFRGQNYTIFQIGTGHLGQFWQGVKSSIS